MKLMFCAACGATDDLQHHHLVTRSEGGGDEPSNLITLCVACHLKMHERQKHGTYNSGQRIKAGLQARRAAGGRIGRRPALDVGQRRKIAERHADGEAMAALADDYKVGVATIWRVLRPEAP